MASTKDDEMPKPGDLIEIFRAGYKHWAIYIGDGFVIHFAQPSDCAQDGSYSLIPVGLLCDKTIVKKEKLCDVVGKDKYRINNLLDGEYEPRPISVIIEQAYSLLGKTLPYSVAKSNCEHFVTEMRYGIPESCQVHNALVSGNFAGLAMLVLGGHTSVPCSKVKK